MVIKRRESSLPLSCFVRTVQNNRGFTLIELIVVCAIIGVLATLALTGLSNFKKQTRTSRAAAEIRGLEKDIIAFASEKGAYPLTLGDIGMADMKDPWGNHYKYAPPPADPLTILGYRTLSGERINSGKEFDLYSKGATGSELIASPDSIIDPASDDDIIRGGDGSFVGTALMYNL